MVNLSLEGSILRRLEQQHVLDSMFGGQIVGCMSQEVLYIYNTSYIAEIHTSLSELVSDRIVVQCCLRFTLTFVVIHWCLQRQDTSVVVFMMIRGKPSLNFVGVLALPT